MNALEYTTFITMLANFIACEVDDDDELGLLGAAITQLGDTLTTISVKRQLCEKISQKDTQNTDSTECEEI